MQSANREEARRCLDKARAAFECGETDYAFKLASKSVRLCFTTEAKEFLERVEKAKSNGVEEKVHQKMKETVHCQEPNPAVDKSEYTSAQNEAVQRVLHCNNYYEMLKVPREVADIELKKQYKHLALLLHPDKNRAPHAEEAFKTISKAYSTLSDPTRRNHYDRFGEDGLQAFPSGATPNTPDDYVRVFFNTRSDFFNIFEDDELFVNQNVFVRHHRTRRHTHRQQGQVGNSFIHLCQVLPIVLIVCVSVFTSIISSILTPPPLFSLQRTSEYTEKKYTSDLNFLYYVKNDFDSKKMKGVERDVEELHIWDLKERCHSDRVWGRGSKSKPCRKLQEITRRKNIIG